MYRIESTNIQNDEGKKNIFRQKLKTVLFFIADFFVFAFCVYALIVKHKAWEVCDYHFNLWIETVSLLGGISFIINFFSYYLLNKIQNFQVDNSSAVNSCKLIIPNRFNSNFYLTLAVTV